MIEEWVIRGFDPRATEKLAAAANLHPVVAGLLISRGISDEASVRRFVDPQLSDIPDPFGLPGMREAAERIAAAVERGERIAVFGDYDADGVTATAILARFLSEVGAAPITALPSRFGEGYGLTASAVEDLKARGARLVVTVDNGTKAFGAVEFARTSGVDVVVTDHHDVADELPPAVAVVNPKRPGSPAELKDLCGAGVAFMVALAVRKLLRESGLLPSPEPNLRRHLDLVAIGAIADSVELTGANRIFAKHGIAEISRSRKAGIKALMSAAGSDPGRITTGAVAFQLAPRINAAGRLADASRALALLVSEDRSEAEEIARELNSANRQRQEVEERIVSEAMAMLEADRSLPSRSAIVLSSEGWHVGVVGIVAAKIAQRFSRPAVVITRDAMPARGSARSFTGINVVDALASCGELLVKFGGHAMAAGLSIEARSIEPFAERFDGECAKLLADCPPRKLAVDAAVAPGAVTEELARQIELLGPFGAGNPEPLLAFEEAQIAGMRIVGNGHLKLTVKSGGLTFDAIGFGMASALPEGTSRVSLAFTPEINTWQGNSSVQLKLRALKPLS